MFFLYKKIAQNITNKFVNIGSIPTEKANIYTYGFEVLISTIVYAFTFIVIGAIAKTMLESLLFFIGFFIVRSIAGGYHANTYIACHILSLCIHLVFISVLKLLSNNAYDYIIVMFALFSFITLIVFAPIDHKNKHFTPQEYKYFRIYSLLYSFIILSCTTIFLSFRFINSILFFSYMFGTFIAAFSVISAKIKKEIKRRTCHEKIPKNHY